MLKDNSFKVKFNNNILCLKSGKGFMPMKTEMRCLVSIPKNEQVSARCYHVSKPGW